MEQEGWRREWGKGGPERLRCSPARGPGDGAGGMALPFHIFLSSSGLVASRSGPTTAGLTGWETARAMGK